MLLGGSFKKDADSLEWCDQDHTERELQAGLELRSLESQVSVLTAAAQMSPEPSEGSVCKRVCECVWWWWWGGYWYRPGRRISHCVPSAAPLSNTHVFKGTQPTVGIGHCLGTGLAFPRGELQFEANTHRGGISITSPRSLLASAVPGPTAMTTSGNLVEMWHLGPQSKPIDEDLHVSKMCVIHRHIKV